jgi:hypothetical protein
MLAAWPHSELAQEIRIDRSGLSNQCEALQKNPA